MSNHRILYTFAISNKSFTPGFDGFIIPHPSSACFRCVFTNFITFRFSPVFMILFSLSQCPTSRISGTITNISCPETSISYQNWINNSYRHGVHCWHSPATKGLRVGATFGTPSEDGQMRAFRSVCGSIVFLSFHSSRSQFVINPLFNLRLIRFGEFHVFLLWKTWWYLRNGKTHWF